MEGKTTGTGHMWRTAWTREGGGGAALRGEFAERLRGEDEGEGRGEPETNSQ